MTDVQAGWYDDGTGRQRWWDGGRWTEHYADMSGATVELHVDSAPVATSGLEAGWYDDTRGRLRWWDGRQWSAQTRFSGQERGFAGIVVDGGWIHYWDATQPVAGVLATIETGGDMTNRSTVTRTLAGGFLLGPAGLIAGSMFKKNVDRRELYVTVEGTENIWVAPVPPALGLQARQFAAWVNSVSRHYTRAG